MFRNFAIAAALVVAIPAQAAVDFTATGAVVTDQGGGNYDFTVGGWGGGGTVSGFFTGFDGDADGQLSSFAGEIDGFGLTYSGGSIVRAFSMTFGDLFGLVYDLDGGILGDGTTLAVEGIGAFGGSTQFLLGPGPFGLCDGSGPCGVIEGPAVPEPATWAMLIAGFGLVGSALRRRGAGLARVQA